MYYLLHRLEILISLALIGKTLHFKRIFSQAIKIKLNTCKRVQDVFIAAAFLHTRSGREREKTASADLLKSNRAWGFSWQSNSGGGRGILLVCLTAIEYEFPCKAQAILFTFSLSHSHWLPPLYSTE